MRRRKKATGAGYKKADKVDKNLATETDKLESTPTDTSLGDASENNALDKISEQWEEANTLLHRCIGFPSATDPCHLKTHDEETFRNCLTVRNTFYTLAALAKEKKSPLEVILVNALKQAEEAIENELKITKDAITLKKIMETMGLPSTGQQATENTQQNPAEVTANTPGLTSTPVHATRKQVRNLIVSPSKNIHSDVSTVLHAHHSSYNTM
jgi:hypothetical protein